MRKLDYPSHNVACIEVRHRKKNIIKKHVLFQNPRWPPAATLDFYSIITHELFVIETITIHVLWSMNSLLATALLSDGFKGQIIDNIHNYNFLAA